MPLAPIHEASCGDSWSTDTDEGARRKEFCDHVEGYGSVCSCKVSKTTVVSKNSAFKNISIKGFELKEHC